MDKKTIERKHPDLSSLAKDLPAIIARRNAGKYLFGIVSVGYLQNLDALGKGPKRLMTAKNKQGGGKVFYLREDLIRWLEEKCWVEDGLIEEGVSHMEHFAVKHYSSDERPNGQGKKIK